MNGETADSEGGIKGAEPVDVVDHAEEDRRREGGVCGQALEVVLNRYAGRGSGVEAGEMAVLEWDVVVEADEFHEHGGDENHEIAHVAGLILPGHYLHIWILGSCSF